ncbi:MAG: T9SS type A sorting domain-containing protein [Bacteroidetes bacterium]|nr:T9SS type A sorting domain-containing protein [Bacteroidota bacterium]
MGAVYQEVTIREVVMRIVVTLFLLITSLFTARAQDETLTARDHYQDALAEVHAEYGEDVRLVLIMALDQPGGLPVTVNALTGKSHMWMYAFYQPAGDLLITAMAVSHPALGTMVQIAGDEPAPEDMNTAAIDENWIDTDEAAEAWKTFGLQAYYDARPGAFTLAIILGGEVGEPALWGAIVEDGVDQLTCLIDAVTAALFSCDVTTNLEDVTSTKNFRLGPPYPNPVATGGVSTVEFHAERAGHVRIAVYDMQGRQQGVVLDQQVPPGTMSLAVPSQLLSRPGVYFIRVETAGGVLSQKLIVTP